MKRFFVQVIWSHIFIVLAGLAALPNTIWAVSTIMQGNERPFGGGDLFLPWLGWMFGGLLLGLTIDVGEITICIQIARGDGTKMRLVAFGLLAVLIFYLQWYYSAAHAGLPPFALGMVSQTTSFTLSLRDIGVWIVPLAMPIITMIYTFGHPSAPKQPTVTVTQERVTERVKVERPVRQRIPPANVPQIEGGAYTAQCLICAYSATKATQGRADAALRMHMRTHQRVEVEQ